MAEPIQAEQIAEVLANHIPFAVESKLREWGVWRRCVREAAIDVVETRIAADGPGDAALLHAGLRRFGGVELDSPEVARRFPGLSLEETRRRILREERLREYQIRRWSEHLPRFFLKHRFALDRVVYSLLRVRSAELAMELFLRIQDGESFFSEMAKEYSEGAEAHTGGMLGPLPASSPHGDLKALLDAAQPGQLCPPRRMGQWFVIVRLEKRLPAQLDDATSEWLLEKCFDEWMEELIPLVQRRGSP